MWLGLDLELGLFKIWVRVGLVKIRGRFRNGLLLRLDLGLVLANIGVSFWIGI